MVEFWHLRGAELPLPCVIYIMLCNIVIIPALERGTALTPTVVNKWTRRMGKLFEYNNEVPDDSHNPTVNMDLTARQMADIP